MTDSRRLTHEELLRYSRQLVMPEVGREGQQKLKSSRVLVVGVGGLGSPAALYLAAAGIGRIGLVDSDVVEVSNLHRQVLYSADDIGVPKPVAAAAHLRALNPSVETVTHTLRLVASNVMPLFFEYDLVVDGSDNFSTRYLVNDASVLLKRPNVHGSVYRFGGQATVFGSPKGPCYRCLHPVPPPTGLVQTCTDAGVLGALAGVIGTILAVEAVKLILGAGDTLVGRMVMVSGLTMKFTEVAVPRQRECPVCGERPTIHRPVDIEDCCTIESDTDEVTPAQLKRMLDQGNKIVLVDVRNREELKFARLDATLIPLSELSERSSELRKDADIVLFCHMGERSRVALRVLRERGFSRVRHLAGGIDRWARDVDATIPRY